MITSVKRNGSEHEYRLFLYEFQENFDYIIREGDPLFTTNASLLWETFLENIPEEQRQYYNCHACRDFIETYGGLVTLAENGGVVPVMWIGTDHERILIESFRALRDKVSKATVTGVFCSDTKTIGKPETGLWKHMALVLPDRFANTSKIKTAGQLRAESKEDFKTLISGLTEYPAELAAQALALVESESLDRSAKFLKNIRWFSELHNRLPKDSRLRRNIIWREVAVAPAGLAHFKNTVLGSLMDDIKRDMSFDELKRRWSAKTDTVKYLRPQAPPTDSNIEQAESIIEKLGLASALRRRLARTDELEYVWQAKKEEQPKSKGLFDHLKSSSKQEKRIETASKPITWTRFLNEVLPEVNEIEAMIVSKANFGQFVTAADPEAKPIVVWDREAERNPVSWYVYDGGSYPKQWGLENKQWVRVVGISYLPEMWRSRTPVVFEPSVVLVLEGASDVNFQKCGLGLFPELLSRDLYEVRRTIEAYSQKGTLEGDRTNAAAGIVLHKDQIWNTVVRITRNGVATRYLLDRWE